MFFEHVTNLLNMRELEDEGKVMALADYAAPIADAENPLIGMLEVRDGVVRTEWAGHALRPALARVHWHYANEQFAYLAQRAVEHAVTALARDAVRLTGSRRIALAGGVVSNVKATRRIRLLPDVEDIYVFPHMGDGGLPLGAAIAAGADVGERLRIDSNGSIWARRTSRPSSRRRSGPLVSPSCVPATSPGVWPISSRRIASSCGFRGAWSTVRGRWGTAASWRVRIGPRCATGSTSCSSVASGISRSVPSLLESEAPRLLADFTGGRNRAMTMAYLVADAFRERLSGVTSVDGTCRPQFVPDDRSRAVCRAAARGKVALGRRSRAQHELQYPQRAARLFAGGSHRRVSAIGGRRLAIGPYLVESGSGYRAAIRDLA